jgi:hypothetical protein
MVPEESRVQPDSYVTKTATPLASPEQQEIASLQLLRQQPSTPATEEALCARIKLLAVTDPARALEVVQRAGTPRQKELLRNAALQGWAAHDSEAACAWTLINVRSEERRVAVNAIAIGAIAQPQEAIRTINHLIALDQSLACDYGNALAGAFARDGQYETASQFAAAGPAEYRAAWLCTVYNQWAAYQPQTALAALEKISDATARGEARAGLVAGWSSSDPASFVAYAQTLPAGEDRLGAFKDGLEQWVHLDLVAASGWMDHFDPGPELDAGAAAVAISPTLVAKKPDIAASWAESITDPELRTNTLLDLIRLWAAHDPAGAHRYAAGTSALPADKRELALSSLQPAP